MGRGSGSSREACMGDGRSGTPCRPAASEWCCRAAAAGAHISPHQAYTPHHHTHSAPVILSSRISRRLVEGMARKEKSWMSASSAGAAESAEAAELVPPASSRCTTCMEWMDGWMEYQRLFTYQRVFRHADHPQHRDKWAGHPVQHQLNINGNAGLRLTASAASPQAVPPAHSCGAMSSSVTSHSSASSSSASPNSPAAASRARWGGGSRGKN